MYQVEVLFSGGSIDTATNGGIGTVIGPNGENQATLVSAGWGFATNLTNARCEITRPGAKQAQPLVNILTHGKASAATVYTKAPNGTAATAYTAVQTLSGANFTGLTVYGLTNANTGVAAAGSSSCWITFGLIA
jgi:hypothetical protein